MKKVAWVALAWGCGSPAFVGGGGADDDGGSDVVVVHEVKESALDDSATDAGADEGLDADAGEPDARSDTPEEVLDPCASCTAPEFGTAVCVNGECGHKCPATCTKTTDGCDCPLAQCCGEQVGIPDEQCGGVACNRGQCSGTYTTCDEPRCWAWCVRCLGKRSGGCPPLHPTQEVFCECED